MVRVWCGVLIAVFGMGGVSGCAGVPFGHRPPARVYVGQPVSEAKRLLDRRLSRARYMMVMDEIHQTLEYELGDGLFLVVGYDRQTPSDGPKRVRSLTRSVFGPELPEERWESESLEEIVVR